MNTDKSEAGVAQKRNCLEKFFKNKADKNFR